LRTLSLLSCTLVGAVAIHAGTSEAFDPWHDEARYEFEYRVDLTSIPAALGESVQLWVPMPFEDSAQQVLSVEVDTALAHQEDRDDLGNRIASLEWVGPAAPGDEVVFRYTVKRAPSIGIPADSVSASHDAPTRYLSAARKIPLAGIIAKLGAQEARGHSSDGEKIRAFYDYVYKNMRYAKTGVGWGQGDAVWACESKYGNCTDFHSVFLGMARSQGIPARFVIGFPISSEKSEGGVSGYHCWAEAWDPARGWLPIDASEAWKARQADAFFGKLPSDRIAFTIGRDLTLTPKQQADPLNYFVYPYAEVAGQPVDNVKAAFRFRRLESPLAAR